MNTKFKIGSIVREIETGDTGIVTKIDIDYFGEVGADDICALWDNTGTEAWFSSDDLSFEVAQPTLIPGTSNHIHAELIKKWAEGAKIEYQDDGEWFPIDKPSWSTKILYRVAAPLQPIATKWVVSNPKRGIEKQVSNDIYRSNDPAMVPFIQRGWIFHVPVIE